MARMPGAVWLGEHSPKTPMSRYDIVCIHTIVGYAPAHAAHFSTHDDGRIGQSRDTKYRSAANLEGNHRVIAIENEDGAKDIPLTDKQIDACAKILAWAHKTHGVPLQLCPNSKPGSRGLAYHRQGVDGNFGGYRYPGRVAGGEKWSTSFGKVCPRDKRIAQLPEILRRAKLIVNPPAPKPAPAPVTSHTRWTIRKTGVHDAPNGKKLRDIPPGYSFSVIDGSGHGNDGWIETTHHNWVLGRDTTTRDPALPVRFSVSTHNVWNRRDWESDVLPTINGILAKHKIDVPNFQECYKAPDLRGKVPGYTFRNQGYGYEPETPGYIEERSDNVILVRDGVDVKVHGADQMTESWAGPKMGVMHDPRVFRRVTVNKDQQNFRVINVHGPFGKAARAEFLTWAREEFEELAALGDPVIFIGDWNVDFETLKAAMGPLATVDGGQPDMVAYVNCRKADSANLGRQGSDTHNFKIWVFEA